MGSKQPLQRHLSFGRDNKNDLNHEIPLSENGETVRVRTYLDEEQLEIRNLLNRILKELVKMNIYLSKGSDIYLNNSDIEV